MLRSFINTENILNKLKPNSELKFKINTVIFLLQLVLIYVRKLLHQHTIIQICVNVTLT